MAQVSKLSRRGAGNVLPPNVRWQDWIADTTYTAYTVTNTSDNTSGSSLVTGSLRWALSQPGDKVVVFQTSGMVTLLQELQIPVTGVPGRVIIAGQTAPAPGFGYKQNRIKVQGSDVAIMHIHGSVGDETNPVPSGNNRDNVSIGKNSTEWVERVLLKNCSFTYSVDENVSFGDGSRNKNSLIYNNIMAFGLSYSIHPEGEHSKGMLIDGKDIYVVNNIFAHHKERHPRLKVHGASNCDRIYWISNHIYGCQSNSKGHETETGSNGSSAGFNHQDNVVGSPVTHPVRCLLLSNVYEHGPGSRRDITRCMQGNPAAPGTKVYMANNRLYRYNAATPSSPTLTCFDNGRTVNGTTYATMCTNNATSGALINLSDEFLDLAPDCNRAACGARPWEARTAVDQRVLDDINNKTGRILNSPVETSYIDTTVTPNVLYAAGPGYVSLATNARALTGILAPPGATMGKDALAWLASFEA